MITHLSSIAAPAFDPRIVDRAYTWLDIVGNEKTAVAAWGEFSASGHLNKSYATVCNSSLQSCAYVAAIPTCSHTDKTAKRYFEWLFERSYAAPYVLCPSTDFGRDIGFVLSGELPSNLLVSILIAARQWREHPGLVRLMFEMVDQTGCPEDLAFALIFSCSLSNVGKTNSNHFPLQPGNTAYVQNFVDRRVVGALNPPLSKNNSYRGVCALWGDDNYMPDLFDEFGKIARKQVKRDTVVITNPFAPVAKTSAYGSKSITKRKLLDLVPGLMEYYANDSRQSAQQAA